MVSLSYDFRAALEHSEQSDEVRDSIEVAVIRDLIAHSKPEGLAGMEARARAAEVLGKSLTI